MVEGLILGIIQGVAEWLPVSSEGLIFLVEINFFGEQGFENLIHLALFLHLGTFLAALVYFWRDVVKIVQSLFSYRKTEEKDKKLLTFLIGTTLISGVVGIFLVKLSSNIFEFNENTGGIITILIGFLLLITAWLQLKKPFDKTQDKKEVGAKDISQLSRIDTILLGVVQGFAVLPGLSRSGLTVASLLLRRFGDEVSLKLSFLMSLPVVLVANIVLNTNYFSFKPEVLIAILVSFLIGLITIHGLLVFARKINIGWFVLIFGLLMIGAGFLV